MNTLKGHKKVQIGLLAAILLLLGLFLVYRIKKSPVNGANVDPLPASTDVVKIEVKETGLYRLSLADLQTAGLAVDALSYAHLQLSQAGTPTPFYIDDNHLIFYGQASGSRYTNIRPYILAVGKKGEAMVETAVTTSSAAPLPQLPQTVHLEENHRYLPQARQNDQSDVWFWQSIGQGQKVALSFDLPAVSDAPATLRLHLRGTTHNPKIELDHDFDLILNGQNLGVIQWDGETLYTSETAVPIGLLKSGSNELIFDNEIAGASFLDIMELNWVELDYLAPATAVNDRLHINQTDGSIKLDGFSGRPLLFDISDKAAPRRLTDWQYENKAIRLSVTPEMHIAAIGPDGYQSPARIAPLRQSDWRTTNNQADLIILTTDELAPALAPLVATREAQGLSVSLIPITEIYDAFGYGEASPESIQTFIAYAYDSWQEPRPRYLFLVGDATTDYRNYQEKAPQNIIPSLLVPVEFSGETVSDSRLVDVDGDMKPDLAVGRWPVNSVQDVENLVDRTLAYEGGTAVNRALFATDNTETQFAAIAATLANQSGLAAETATFLDGAQANEVIAAWNQGAWLTTYIGHGSVQRWGKEDVFFPEAVADLAAATPPIVIQLTCLSGLFAHPELTSLSETMLLHEQGPVLIVGATSLTLSSYQEPFALSLLQNMQDTANSTMGDAFQQAKQSLNIGNDNGLREISDTFVLLGDPSARIIRP